MANKASAENVQADMQPPNYRSAVQRIRTIPAKKDKISSVNGEIADIYAKIEGHKVNRKAAKIFYALDRIEGDERADVLRSLNGLCDASGWDETSEDLVDQAEGNVVHMRVGSTRSPAVEDGDVELDEALADEAAAGDDLDEALGDDAFTEASEEELAAQAGRGSKKDKAAQAGRGSKKDKAAQAGRGSKKDKAAQAGRGSKKDKAAAVPFTGDNSDLAGAQPQGNA